MTTPGGRFTGNTTGISGARQRATREPAAATTRPRRCSRWCCGTRAICSSPRTAPASTRWSTCATAAAATRSRATTTRTARNTSVISQRGLVPGTYYVYVDGATAADAGAFTVDIYAMPASANAARDVRQSRCRSPPAPRPATPAASRTTTVRPPSAAAASGPTAWIRSTTSCSTQRTPVTFSTCDSTCIDTVLYMRDVCSEPGGQTECDDDGCPAPRRLPAGRETWCRAT